MVIEDQPEVASGQAALLAMDGHQVEVAREGTEGVRRVRELRPEGALSDLGLPDLDGRQEARLIRADPELRQVTLVALTGRASREDVASALGAGFDRHLAKPRDLAELPSILAGSTASGGVDPGGGSAMVALGPSGSGRIRGNPDLP